MMVLEKNEILNYKLVLTFYFKPLFQSTLPSFYLPINKFLYQISQDNFCIKEQRQGISLSLFVVIETIKLVLNHTVII